MTASELFSGIKDNGENKCYYCGSSCDDKHGAKDYVKSTFTNRDIVAYPGSSYVCGGCALVMSSDNIIELLDGENREHQRIRSYSWIITQDERIAATKKHIAQLREIVLNPPEPPFVIVLSDSGQKQLLFRASVSLERDNFPVMLEDKIIIVNRKALKERIDLATQIIAVTGKPGAMELNIAKIAKIKEYYGSLKLYENWIAVKDEPISQLAVWLSKPMKEAKIEYPKS